MNTSALITPFLSPPPLTLESTIFSVDLYGESLGWQRKGPSSPGSLLLMLVLYHTLRMGICDSLQLPILVPLLSMSTGTAVSIFISVCCVYILLLDKTTPVFIHRIPEGVKLEVVNYSFPRVSVYSIAGSILRRGMQLLRMLLDMSIFWYCLVHMEENHHPQSSPYMPSAKALHVYQLFKCFIVDSGRPELIDHL